MAAAPLLCLLLLFSLASAPLATPGAVASGTMFRSKPQPLVFQLRSIKAQSLVSRRTPHPAPPAPQRAPNKLRFHHNVTLVVSLAVGSPPQNVSMVLDTGSELSWLPCFSAATAAGASKTSSSASSSSPSPIFVPRASTSFAAVACSSPVCRSQATGLPVPATCDDATGLCRVSLAYADASSADGSLASDLFAVGDSPSIRAAFGCVASFFDSSSGAVGAAGAGLLGMNRGKLSFVSQSNTRRFSYCISDVDDAGVLVLGHGNLPFLTLNYTPLYAPPRPLPFFDRAAYSVELVGIRVGAVRLPISPASLAPDHTGAGQTMLDSGTQFTFLLGDAYSAVKAEFTRQSALPPLDEPDFAFQGALDACFRLRRPPATVPSVVLEFRASEMVVSGPERLLYSVDGERWCLTFGNADLVGMTANVIGHHHQQNVWVEHDIAGGRVGMATVRCDVAGQKLGVALAAGVD